MWQRVDLQFKMSLLVLREPVANIRNKIKRYNFIRIIKRTIVIWLQRENQMICLPKEFNWFLSQNEFIDHITSLSCHRRMPMKTNYYDSIWRATKDDQTLALEEIYCSSSWTENDEYGKRRRAVIIMGSDTRVKPNVIKYKKKIT